MKTIKLKDILSISGKSGLFKYLAQARNGVVVESIEEKKRHVAPASARVSSLEDIAIFTHDEEVPLSDVFMRIHEKTEGKETISHKASAEELKAYFEELVPEYDDERVYLSDIKKVFQWYNQLHAHGMLEVIDKEEKNEEEAGKDGGVTDSEDTPGKAETAPVKAKTTPVKAKEPPGD
jgi:ribosomal protein L24